MYDYLLLMQYDLIENFDQNNLDKVGGYYPTARY